MALPVIRPYAKTTAALQSPTTKPVSMTLIRLLCLYTSAAPIVPEENEAGCRELPAAAEMEMDCRPGDVALNLFTDCRGNGGLSIRYDDSKREITVDRSGMRNRFNPEEGASRTRPLEEGLHHLRIFTDASSVEIFVNDGDAVFTSRIFPTEEERWFSVAGDVFSRIWTVRPAVRDSFLI